MRFFFQLTIRPGSFTAINIASGCHRKDFNLRHVYYGLESWHVLPENRHYNPWYMLNIWSQTFTTSTQASESRICLHVLTVFSSCVCDPMWLQTQHRIPLNPWRSRIQIARLDFSWSVLMIHTIHGHSTITPLTLGYTTKIECPGQWEHQRLLEAKQSLRIRAEIPSVFVTYSFLQGFFL